MRWSLAFSEIVLNNEYSAAENRDSPALSEGGIEHTPYEKNNPHPHRHFRMDPRCAPRLFRTFIGGDRRALL
jgi:hypothetical protein